MKLLIASHACATPLNQKLFALAAQRRGWQVTMVLPRQWRNEYGKYLPASLLEGFDAELISLPVFKNGSVPLHTYVGRLAGVLNRVKPDVIYSHNEAYAISTAQWCWANASSLRRPFGFFSCQNLVKTYPLPFRRSEAWVYRQSSFFFPITQNVESVHREKGYDGSSTVLPLGFDPEIYQATNDPAERALAAEGRPFRFAYVGRLVEEKGLITLAAALASLKDIDWHLIIVGDGPFMPQFEAALRSEGIADRVEWKGYVPHLEAAQFYESVDATLIPSETRSNWKEQFGRVIVESMACGTPVVGSDSGEIPVLIRQTGGGLIFPEANSESLHQALRKIALDHRLRAQLASQGHIAVTNSFTLPHLADRFADSIEEAISSHP